MKKLKLKKSKLKLKSNYLNEYYQKNAAIIVKKALKIAYARSGNPYIYHILYKDADTLSDLINSIILDSIENNIKLNNVYFPLIPKRKKLYAKVYKIIYDNKQVQYSYRKDENGNTYKVINYKSCYIEDEQENIIRTSLNHYLLNTINIENTNFNYSSNHKTILNDLQLTKRQLEILNIYADNRSYKLTSEILNISTNTVKTTILRLKKRIKAA